MRHAVLMPGLTAACLAWCSPVQAQSWWIGQTELPLGVDAFATEVQCVDQSCGGEYAYNLGPPNHYYTAGHRD